MSGLYRRLTEPSAQPVNRLLDAPTQSFNVYTPPSRNGSPFQPPPLSPLNLQATRTSDPTLLTRSLAEEIRLLVPARLQLVDNWRLAYSLDRDGASLATLYQHCERIGSRSQRAGYILVVRDESSVNNGSVFGAYLTDPPKPSPHYYGTGECFLWRASMLPSTSLLNVKLGGTTPPSEELLELAGLPPPPSADTTNLQRATTIRSERSNSKSSSPVTSDHLSPPPPLSQHPGGMFSGASTPERIRFKAFPYSGMNDFMIYCEPSYLSVGGGDGHYGLWLDDTLEKGISQSCPTFGNEELSDEGEGKANGRFNVLGVEVWYLGA